MWLWKHKKLTGAAAAVALLSGGAGALAATQLSSNPRDAFINDLASRLHVTPTALRSAMKQARIDQINAAEKAGKLTAGQAAAAKSAIENGHGFGAFAGPGGPPPGFGPGGPRPGFGPGGPRPGFGPGGPPAGFGPGAMPVRPGRWSCGGTSTTTTSTTATPCKGGPPGRFGPAGGWSTCRSQSSKTTTNTTTTNTTTTSCPGGPGFGPHPRFGFGIGFGPFLGGSAVTSYLGVSAATLRSDLAAGKSLAQIASTTSGKSVSGLESAITAAVRARLDGAVSAGWMTAAQEAKVLSALPARLSGLVNHSF